MLPLQLLAQGEKTRIYGKITDAGNKEPLPYASVRISRTSIGSSSDNNGNFSFYAPAMRDTLIVSSVGYQEKRIALSAKTRLPIKVSLKPADYTLSELTVKPKKEKYRKKDNPAVALVREITVISNHPRRSQPSVCFRLLMRTRPRLMRPLRRLSNARLI